MNNSILFQLKFDTEVLRKVKMVILKNNLRNK